MFPDIDPLPKYYKLYKSIKELIDGGKLRPGDTLPSERDLCDKHELSRGTVRKAIDVLERAGYVNRKQGLGTFVAPSKIKHNSLQLSGYSEDMQLRGMVPGQQILSFSYEKPSEVIRDKLELPAASEQVLKIVRLRTADEEPMGLQTVFLPFTYSDGFKLKALLDYGSLYELLENEFGLIVSEADEVMEVSIADEEQAKILDIPIHSPLIKVDRIAWSDSLRPMEITNMYYRGDRYRYYWHISR